jgi:two-component system CheB/CheR fusion protein
LPTTSRRRCGGASNGGSPLRRLQNLREYVELLAQDPAEVSALAEEVLIHVTSFFRDPDLFEALRARVLPKLLAHRSPVAPIRIWIPGCSTGEEVYSIGITLLEYLASVNATNFPIQLFGTDVSPRAIERARSGKYPEGIGQDVSPARLAAFFTQIGSAYQIRKDVRDACVFAAQDATRDPPFSGVDIISCRNLMIYLASPLQARVLSIFHYALKEPGFLLLGGSETIHSFLGFAAFDAKARIYQRTSAALRALPDFLAPELPLQVVPPASHAAGAATLDVYREADRLVLAEFAPPGVIVSDDAVILQFRGQTGIDGTLRRARLLLPCVAAQASGQAS